MNALLGSCRQEKPVSRNSSLRRTHPAPVALALKVFQVLWATENIRVDLDPGATPDPPSTHALYDIFAKAFFDASLPCVGIFDVLFAFF